MLLFVFNTEDCILRFSSNMQSIITLTFDQSRCVQVLSVTVVIVFCCSAQPINSITSAKEVNVLLGVCLSVDTDRIFPLPWTIRERGTDHTLDFFCLWI